MSLELDKYRKIYYAKSIICENCSDKNDEKCRKCHITDMLAKARDELCDDLIEHDCINAADVKTGDVIKAPGSITDTIGEVICVTVTDGIYEIMIGSTYGLIRATIDNSAPIEYYGSINKDSTMTEFLLYGANQDAGISLYKYIFNVNMHGKKTIQFKSTEQIIRLAQTLLDNNDNRVFSDEKLDYMREHNEISNYEMHIILNHIARKCVSNLDGLTNVQYSIDFDNRSIEVTGKYRCSVIASNENDARLAIKKKEPRLIHAYKDVKFECHKDAELIDTVFITSQFI